MLRDDAFVLDRHLVPRERDHLRAELGVLVEERSAPHRRRLGRHHAASVAAASARSRISRYVSKESRRRASSAGTQRTSSYSRSCADMSPPVGSIMKKFTNLWTRSPGAANQ